MAISSPVKTKIPDNMPTKIVGVTHDGRQQLLERCQRLDIKVLEVVRDPLNRYDSDAVALDAVITSEDGRELERMRLGFLSNADRMCMTCAKLVDGGTFLRSRIVKCPECGHLSQFTTPGRITCHNKVDTSTGARSCGTVFETDMAKTVVCPTCFGDEFVRGGLASVFARAIDDGVKYRCIVEQYTGGEKDEKGKVKTRGCNIRLVIADADKPI